MCVCVCVCVFVCVFAHRYFLPMLKSNYNFDDNFHDDYDYIAIFIIAFSMTIKGEKGFCCPPTDSVASQDNQTKYKNQNHIPISSQKCNRPILAAECVVAGGDKGHIRMWRPQGTSG